MLYLSGRRKVASAAPLKELMMAPRRPNHRAALDAGTAFCYMSGVIGPARVSAGRSAKE